MSMVTTFDTELVRRWDRPRADTFATLMFPRPFVAPPRLPCGFRKLDIDRRANIRARATIEDIRYDAAIYHVISWADTTLYRGVVDSLNLAPASLEFLSGTYMRNLEVDPDSPRSVRIDFERPFVTPPKVVVFVNHIDLDRSRNWRLSTTASDVDATGFTLIIDSYSDTILNAAQVDWVAYPEDREQIFSASVSTARVRLGAGPQSMHSESVDFGNIEFCNTPSVFVALNAFDISCGANLRINTYVDNVTARGLTWHIESWSNTVLYYASATIIAVN